jgi:hypothetical protein
VQLLKTAQHARRGPNLIFAHSNHILPAASLSGRVLKGCTASLKIFVPQFLLSWVRCLALAGMLHGTLLSCVCAIPRQMCDRFRDGCRLQLGNISICLLSTAHAGSRLTGLRLQRIVACFAMTDWKVAEIKQSESAQHEKLPSHVREGLRGGHLHRTFTGGPEKSPFAEPWSLQRGPSQGGLRRLCEDRRVPCIQGIQCINVAANENSANAFLSEPCSGMHRFYCCMPCRHGMVQPRTSPVVVVSAFMGAADARCICNISLRHD